MSSDWLLTLSCTGPACFGLTVGCIGKSFFGLVVGCTGPYSWGEGCIRKQLNG